MPRPPPPADALMMTGIADLGGDARGLVVVGDRAVRAGHDRNAEALGGALGLDLVAHDADMVAGRADEGDVVRGQDVGELGVLRQEAVARMHRVGAGDLAGGDDLVDVEIAVARRRRADADALVGEPHMHGVGVGGRMHGDGLDAELLAGAQDPERDLAAIGDEDLLEHALVPLYSITTSGIAVFDRLRILEQDRRDRAGARRRDLVHRLHRLDDQQRLAFLDRLADLDEGLGVGRRRQIGGADHRRGHGVLRRHRRLPAASGAGAAGRVAAGEARGWRRGDGMDGRRLARDADLQVAELDLDLGQVGVVQDAREIADQLLVKPVFFVVISEPSSLSGRQIRAASACSASV